MIQYYQELLNECIDIAEAKTKYKNMLLTLLKMKYRLKRLKGGKRKCQGNIVEKQ